MRIPPFLKRRTKNSILTAEAGAYVIMRYVQLIFFLLATVCCIHCSKKIITINSKHYSLRDLENYASSRQGFKTSDIFSNRTLFTNLVYDFTAHKLIAGEINKTNIFSSPSIASEWTNLRSRLCEKYLNERIATNTAVRFEDYRLFNTTYYIKLFLIKHFVYLPSGLGAAASKIADAEKMLDQGGTFIQTANKFSDLPDARKGGRIIAPGEKIPPAVIKKLEMPGNFPFSAPFTADGKIYIVKLISKNIISASSAEYTYQQIMLDCKSPEEQNLKIKLADEIFLKLKNGYDFAAAANEYTEDQNNFSGGAFAPFDKFSKYHKLVSYLEKAEAGTVIRKIPVDTAWVYVLLEKKEQKSADEIRKFRSDEEFTAQIRSAKEYLAIQDHRQTVIDSPQIKRHYEDLFAPSLKTNCLIASFRDHNFFLDEAIKEIYQGADASFLSGVTSQPERLAQEIEFKYLRPRIFRLYYFYEPADKKLAETLKNEKQQFCLRSYRQFFRENTPADTTPQKITELYQKYRDSRFVNILPDGKKQYRPFSEVSNQVYESYVEDEKNRLYDEHIKLLFNQYHIIYHTNNFPAGLFSDEIMQYKSQHGSRLDRLFLYMDKNSTARLINSGNKALAAGMKILKNAGNNTNSSIINQKAEEKILEAEKYYHRAFLANPSRMQLLIDVSEKFFSYNDFRRARDWIIKLRQSPAFSPDLYDELLKNAEEKKRWYIIEAMGYFPDDQIRIRLENVLTNAAAIEEKCFAIEALGRIGRKESVPVLKKFYTNNIWGVRLLAGQSLESITGGKFPVELSNSGQPGGTNKK